MNKQMALATDEKYMQRCIELAAKGAGNVAPNPMVGAVIVYKDEVIGQGYHERYGEAHAEVNAINAVKDKSLLKKSTLYVNLEPCSHYGKTPPCTEKIIEYNIPKVIVGHEDPFPIVKGGGIKVLREHGVEVITGILRDECAELNKRFFTFHQKNRPYIILKWAESADGFIDKKRKNNNEKRLMLSTNETMKLLHQLRAKEAAILVGTNTALQDNPSLTVKLVEGNNPVRLVLDRKLKIPADYRLFDTEAKTIVYTEKAANSHDNIQYVKIDFEAPLLPQLMHSLYYQYLISLVVEGGRTLLNEFIASGLWDEIRIETAYDVLVNEGIKSPEFDRANPTEEKKFGNNIIRLYKKEFNL
jgi:diaminohydroxyphosphoribosylaminopyrimidine deaminase/5-amino-6-(5-phosphoribosylamino)uracil reductase